MQIFDFTEGTTPLLVSMPHCGTRVPRAIAARMKPRAQLLADTDWHVDRLYDFAVELGASVLRPQYSRYVIDLNRPADNAPLYRDARGTSLCPTADFDGNPLYLDGETPSATEVQLRLRTWWRPYHDKLQSELERIRAEFGIAQLFEAHSIRSQVPALFDGKLPDISVGTVGGRSCAPGLLAAVCAVLDQQADYSFVVDQRFKGGHITRAYGAPLSNVHAVQLELAQCNYMEEQPPFTYLTERALPLQAVLRRLMERIIDWGRNEAGAR